MKIKDKNFYIFSAGKIGKMITDFFLDKYKAQPIAIVDNFKKGNYRGIKILPEKKIKNVQQFKCVIGIYNHYISLETLEKRLNKKFLKSINVICLKRYFNSLKFDFWLTDIKKTKKIKSEFYNISKYLHDEKSKKLLKRIYLFRSTGKKSYYVNNMPNTYMSFKKKFPKKLTILDLGCYQGQFLDILKKNKFILSNAYCVEPDKKNYSYLIKKYRKFKNYLFYNYVVGSRSKHVKFDSRGSDSSRVSKYGNTLARSINLDKTFFNKKINIIKMDVEGYEYKALKNLKKIIVKNKPILLISVYHYYKDIIDTLNFLAKFKNNYNFHLRVHEHNTFGIVLYGMPK